MKQEHKWYIIAFLFAVSGITGLIKIGIEICKALQ
mgnify:CR=1 FL=1